MKQDRTMEMLKAIIKARPQEQTSLHITLEGNYVINNYCGPSQKTASTLEQAIEDYHAEMFGFTEIEQKRKAG